ncbi:MAG: glycosyltransferase, partial [Armatimonadetes bacterium]|nr:glycosyltransferase [Armatimonadota bacterium]NIO75718.1 glycosyltransferase [Armatimonadota bacterium]NIO96943.1 glycosyltransferase [Armatimonadota bacterium]
NLSHEVQRERARWLYRLAKMGDRWQIRIAGGVYGEDYVRMLNQSKITFNRSIRSEFNMRCYEAAACGSLLFYDEENQEVRDYFEDRVHCVLYNDSNFEELLEHYLTHDEEREAITASAHKRVGEIAQPQALLKLLGRVEELGLLNGNRPTRPYVNLPFTERRKRHARQIFHTMTSSNLSLATNWISEAMRQSPDDPSLLNDYTVMAAYLAEAERDNFIQGYEAAEAAMEMGRRAIKANPKSALAHINLGEICRRHRCLQEAQEHFMAALSILEEGDTGANDLLELHFPFEHDQFRTQYETLYAVFAGDDENLRLARRCLLIYQAGMALGELAEVQGSFKQAGQAYQTAALARPDLGRARAALARCVERLGQIDDALEQLQIAFTTDPFLSDEWFTYADLLIARGRHEEAQEFLEERITVVRSVPSLSYLEQPLQKRLLSLTDVEAGMIKEPVSV